MKLEMKNPVEWDWMLRLIVVRMSVNGLCHIVLSRAIQPLPFAAYILTYQPYQPSTIGRR